MRFLYYAISGLRRLNACRCLSKTSESGMVLNTEEIEAPLFELESPLPTIKIPPETKCYGITGPFYDAA
jgi:hypothetical protein